MFNHHRGLWGYTGHRRRRRAADRAGHRHGRAERGDRHRGADRARRASAGPDRHLRRARRGPRAGRPGGRRDGALGRRRQRRAGRRRRARAPTRRCWSAWSRPARGPAPWSAPTSSTTRATARSPSWVDARRRRWSRWRRPRSSQVAARRGVAAGCVLAVTDVPGSGGPRRVDAERLRADRPALGEAGYAAPRSAEPRCGDSLTVRRSCARGIGLSPGATASRRAARSRAISSSRCSTRSSSDLTARRREPLLEPVDRVLDALEPLRERAQAAGDALDVGRRGQVEGAHRGLLGLRRPSRAPRTRA